MDGNETSVMLRACEEIDFARGIKTLLNLRQSRGVWGGRTGCGRTFRHPAPHASRSLDPQGQALRMTSLAHQHPSKVHHVVGQRRPQGYAADLRHPSDQHTIQRSVGTKLGVHRLVGRGPKPLHRRTRRTSHPHTPRRHGRTVAAARLASGGPLLLVTRRLGRSVDLHSHPFRGIVVLQPQIPAVIAMLFHGPAAALFHFLTNGFGLTAFDHRVGHLHNHEGTRLRLGGLLHVIARSKADVGLLHQPGRGVRRRCPNRFGLGGRNLATNLLFDRRQLRLGRLGSLNSINPCLGRTTRRRTSNANRVVKAAQVRTLHQGPYDSDLMIRRHEILQTLGTHQTLTAIRTPHTHRTIATTLRLARWNGKRFDIHAAKKLYGHGSQCTPAVKDIFSQALRMTIASL